MPGQHEEYPAQPRYPIDPAAAVPPPGLPVPGGNPAPRQSSRKRRPFVLAGLAATAVVLAAGAATVSSRSEQGSPAETLRSATDRSLASSSVTLVGSARFSAGSNVGDLGVQAQVDLVHMNGTGVLASGSTQERIVTDGETVWISSNATTFAAALPAAASWAEAPVARLSATPAWHPLSDSLAVLYLTRGAGAVHDDGSGKVNGITAHRYSFPIDLHRAYCATAESERRAVQWAVHADSSAIVSGQAWIDQKRRVIQLLVTVAEDKVQLHYQVDLSNFNAPVPVTPPPASQVTALTPELLGILGLDSSTPPPVSCP